MGKEPERWRLEHQGESHVVDVTPGFRRELVWLVDGVEVARKRTTDDRTTVGAEGRDDRIALKISSWTDSARRVALHPASSTGGADASAALGTGGIDFVPDPGTKAARRQERMLAHPRLFFLQRTGGALAAVFAALAAAWVGRQLLSLLPDVDVKLPRLLPEIDFPRILPDIDLPDLPDLPELPEWVGALSPFVVPVLIAAFIARGELRRRRAQLEHPDRAPHLPRTTTPDRTDEPQPAEDDDRQADSARR